MQPFLFISGDVPGLIYVNGRLAGKSDAEPVCVPVSPTGAVYIEYRPMSEGYIPLARAIALSRGTIVPGSVPGGRGLSVVAWPGAIAEVFAQVQPLTGYESEAPLTEIYIDETTRQTITPLGDVVGHAIVTTKRLAQGEWTVLSSEIMWATDGPKWPQTPEDTAIAAAQAAILNLRGEARGYIAPGRADVERRLTELGGTYDGCAKATYGASADVVALVKIERENLAGVTFARYFCSKMGGGQGEWRLERFDIVSGTP
ncbi:MAG: hypothetical protein Q4D04_03630 [Clostridia bacterium]|nr:hypothetical protein [Clostridia bacterium]